MSNRQYLTKITNEDLERLIDCAINIKHSNCLPAAYERSWLEALQNKELEIEGYVRKDHFRDAAKMVDEWTKFDPNDPKTFPPCKGVYLVCRGVEPYFREAKFYGEQVGFGDTCVILWRPLPKLPLEIDGCYIREDRPECFSCDTPPPGKEKAK